MTYGQFLALFLGIPLACLAVAMRRRYTAGVWLTFGLISLLALVYTGPWDNLIIVNGVWSYGRHQVWGLLIGHVPLEEYIFYILQVVLTGSLTVWLMSRWER